jgi:hypothetical protein
MIVLTPSRLWIIIKLFLDGTGPKVPSASCLDMQEAEPVEEENKTR